MRLCTQIPIPGTPGSSGRLLKGFRRKKGFVRNRKDTDDITSEKDTHLYIECFSSRLAVYVNDEKLVETETSMPNGVEYSSWAARNLRAKKTDENALFDK